MSETTAIPAQGLFRRLLREIVGWSITLKLGVLLMAAITFCAVFAPWLADYDPYAQDYEAILLAPDLTHLFGTDQIGRDIFSRILHGARIDLAVAFVMTFVPMLYGVPLGAWGGYRGGLTDKVVDGLSNLALSFPFLILIIVVVAVIGQGVQAIFISVLLLAWTMYARLARAEMMVERAKDYMLAARVLGFPTYRIILLHGLPNVLTSSIVFSMSDFILNILLLSSLSFIGFGIQPPTPEWGSMIAEGKDFMLQAWWVSTIPGLAVVMTGIALSLLGDGLSQRLGARHAGGTA